MIYILFIVGFFVLIKGAEWLIDGAHALGKKFGASDLLIGLTIIAFGTSLPELVINLFAGAQGEGDLALGNVIGSNIANTLLILGVAAVIHPLTIHRTVVYREVIFNILATIMLAVLVADLFIGNNGGLAGLDTIDGIVLISYFFLFLFYAFKRSALMLEPIKTTTIDYFGNFKIALKIIIGAIALYVGGRWIVEGAIEFASLLGASETLIGTTVVALGTSLPELAATVAAVRKHKIDAAVGNILGSNLFNILWVLGVGAFLVPIEISDETLLDIYIAVGVALILFGIMVFGKYRHQISKNEGKMFLVLYALYLLIASLNGFGVLNLTF